MTGKSGKLDENWRRGARTVCLHGNSSRTDANRRSRAARSGSIGVLPAGAAPGVCHKPAGAGGTPALAANRFFACSNESCARRLPSVAARLRRRLPRAAGGARPLMPSAASRGRPWSRPRAKRACTQASRQRQRDFPPPTWRCGSDRRRRRRASLSTRFPWARSSAPRG